MAMSWRAVLLSVIDDSLMRSEGGPLIGLAVIRPGETHSSLVAFSQAHGLRCASSSPTHPNTERCVPLTGQPSKLDGSFVPRVPKNVLPKYTLSL